MEQLLRGLLENVDWSKVAKAAVALIAGAVIAYKVKGVIDKKKLQDALKENGMEEAIIDTVNRKGRVVILKGIKSSKKINVEGGERISDELQEGQRIHI